MNKFDKIRAEELMQTEVVTFTPSTPIADALRTFEELQINGAPVVDAYGKIIGMLSAFDVARTEHLSGGRIDAEGGLAATTESCDYAGEDRSEQEDIALSMDDFGPATAERPTVSDWMSAEIACVGPDWTLSRVCRLMVSQHVHRVPVVEDKQLMGIITSFDIVRCVGEGIPQSLRR